jgi:hypothetical protein
VSAANVEDVQAADLPTFGGGEVEGVEGVVAAGGGVGLLDEGGAASRGEAWSRPLGSLRQEAYAHGDLLAYLEAAKRRGSLIAQS